MRRALTAAAAAAAALLVAAAPAGAAERPSTPALIEQAQNRGDISRATALTYLRFALAGDARLPDRFASRTPFDATMPMLELQRAGAAGRREPKDPPPADPGATNCGFPGIPPLSNEPENEKLETEHFFIEYSTNEVQTLDVEEYGKTLEAAWDKEVDAYGWAKPPFKAPREPGNPTLDKYHVRVSNLGPAIFGYVSPAGTYAGDVKDNPNTPWVEADAHASCMVLNNDFGNFASDPDVPDAVEAQRALEATAAHEFLHSVQFAYGGLTGDDDPDLTFSEGMATWMEDEVFEGANDNVRYLYPDFADSMGNHVEDMEQEYAYWFVWRGLVERFGIGVPGGAEQALQGFWEIRSRGDADNTAPVGLDAVRASLQQGKGISLDDAYHEFAVGARFVKDCANPLAPPFCFAEGDIYTGGERGRPASHGEVERLGASFAGEVEDNFALNWVNLPRDAAEYDVTLVNRTPAGTLRLSVVCDMGGDLRRASAGNVTGLRAVTTRFNPSGCLSQPVAVVTNHTQTEPDPDEDVFRTYQVAVNTPPPPVREEPTTTRTTTEAPPADTTPTTASCTATELFRSATVQGRGRRARFGFSRSGGGPVTVSVFQHSVGRRVIGERLVARFTRRRGFTWNGRANRRGQRVRDGVLSVRFRTRSTSGRVDTRRETLRRSRGRYTALRDFDRPETCAGVRAFKLLRPAFGGRTNRTNEVTFVLGGEANVLLQVRRGTQVVRRIDAGQRAPGIIHRLRVDSEGLARGEYEFRLVVQAAGRPLTERLFARRL